MLRSSEDVADAREGIGGVDQLDQLALDLEAGAVALELERDVGGVVLEHVLAELAQVLRAAHGDHAVGLAEYAKARQAAHGAGPRAGGNGLATDQTLHPH